MTYQNGHCYNWPNCDVKGPHRENVCEPKKKQTVIIESRTKYKDDPNWSPWSENWVTFDFLKLVEEMLTNRGWKKVTLTDGHLKAQYRIKK